MRLDKQFRRSIIRGVCLIVFLIPCFTAVRTTSGQRICAPRGGFRGVCAPRFRVNTGFCRPFFGGYRSFVGVGFGGFGFGGVWNGWGSPILYPPAYTPAYWNYGLPAISPYLYSTPFNQVNRFNVIVNRPKRAPRVSNPSSRARARHWVDLGDRLFQQQRFHDALQHYKTAAKAAPDLAEPHRRQGHALVATRRYDLAVAAYRKADQRNARMDEQTMSLAKLYGVHRATKTGNLEALAQATIDSPNRAELYFLIGVFLKYDGQSARGQKFFQEAVRRAPQDEMYKRAIERPKNAVLLARKRHDV